MIFRIADLVKFVNAITKAKEYNGVKITIGTRIEDNGRDVSEISVIRVKAKVLNGAGKLQEFEGECGYYNPAMRIIKECTILEAVARSMGGRNLLKDVFGLVAIEENKRSHKVFRLRDLNKSAPIVSPSHLAMILNVPLNRLWFMAYSKNHFKMFKIPKENGGYRVVYSPTGFLKFILKRLADYLAQYDFPEAVHSYIPGRSIVTAAETIAQGYPYDHETHTTLMYKIDLKDFFDHASLNKIKESLMFAGYPNDAAYLIAELCTFPPRHIDKSLEQIIGQGLPTSPILSNFAFLQTDLQISSFLNPPPPVDIEFIESTIQNPEIDEDLRKALSKDLEKFRKETEAISKIQNFGYVRFSDDIIIFAKQKGDPTILKENLLYTAEQVKKIIRRNGWQINEKKTGLLTEPIVFGLSVASHKVTLPTSKRRIIKNLYNFILAHNAWRLNPNGQPEPDIRQHFVNYREVQEFIKSYTPYSKLTIKHKGKDIQIRIILKLLQEIANKQFLKSKIISALGLSDESRRRDSKEAENASSTTK